MSKKIYVDANGKAVGEGSAEAAFIYNEGDARLDKFRDAMKARQALAAGKPDPRPANRDEAADDDGSVERVARKR